MVKNREAVLILREPAIIEVKSVVQSDVINYWRYILIKKL